MQRFPLDDRGSFAWIVHPGEALGRASAAIALDGGCLLVDPLAAPELDEALGPLGTVHGIVTLLDRHRRDAEALASRLGCPRLRPRALGGPGVGVAGVEERAVIESRWWKEALLWLPERRLLVCAETLGTIQPFRAREGDRLGLHPLARLLRVRSAFAGVAPAAIAVGHGPPLLEGAAAALAEALAGQRRDLPRAWSRAVAYLARKPLGFAGRLRKGIA